MQSVKIKISKLKNNSGQIAGVKKNPRIQDDAKFQKLKKSLQDFPEMLELRELVVVPLDKDFIVVGGNMRLKALKELGEKEAVCKVLPADFPPEKINEFIVKDNVSFGLWDGSELSEWDSELLNDWGYEVPEWEFAKEAEAVEDNVQTENRALFCFNSCNSYLKTKGVHYYAIYRNNGMDLEALKSKTKNANPFIFPVVSCFNELGVNSVILPPAGGRANKNGFHFASYVIQEAAKYINIEIKTPFININNKIQLRDDFDITDISEKDFIFDDIITRGNTLLKLNELINVKNNIILLTNH